MHFIMLTRAAALAQLTGQTWDLVVVGGGATGLGTAVDAVARGYKTVLLEQSDFSKATSSRSTKLIHGGVRYLQQGNVSLVRESLHERGLLLRNAPEFVRPLELIIPAHSLFEKVYYTAGLKAYDLLAGRLGMAGSSMLSVQETERRLPTLKKAGFSGGVSYFDAQFDDARLAVALAEKVRDLGGIPLNYVKVHALLKENGRIRGVEAEDGETGDRYTISAKVVVNATGIFSDRLRRLDDAQAPASLSLSQGAHIVVDRSFLPGSTAIIVPRTRDGRVVFIIPWHGATLIGTTDTPCDQAELEPRPLHAEVNFLIEHANMYLAKTIQRSDIRSCFAGLRPLVKNDHTQQTSRISRDHVVRVSDSVLVSVIGGKWTTFRKMGEDAVKAAALAGGLESRPGNTESLMLTAAHVSQPVGLDDAPGVSDDFIRDCVQTLMARSVEDVLARRSRLLFTDVEAAVRHAPHVATVLADELKHDEHWIASQVSEFRQTAESYFAP